MWCPNCQADVSADVSVDNRIVYCSTCREELSTVPEHSEKNSTRDARDLLLRWSNSALIDPFGPDIAAREKHSTSRSVPALPQPLPKSTATTSASDVLTNPTIQSQSVAVPPLESISAAIQHPESNAAVQQLSPLPNPAEPLISNAGDVHEALPGAAGGFEATPLPSSLVSPSADPLSSARAPSPNANESAGVAQVTEQQGVSSKVRIDVAHSPQSTSPSADLASQAEQTSVQQSQTAVANVNVQDQIVPSPESQSNWQSPIGQILAYFGIGLITVGTVLVLWSYYGGPAQYAPTGWFATTIGQMLLFLGVVTLISGGMEQTTREVNRRIETIGARLIRIEQHTRDQPTVPRPKYLDRMKDGQNRPAQRVEN